MPSSCVKEHSMLVLLFLSVYSITAVQAVCCCHSSMLLPPHNLICVSLNSTQHPNLPITEYSLYTCSVLTDLMLVFTYEIIRQFGATLEVPVP